MNIIFLTTYFEKKKNVILNQKFLVILPLEKRNSRKIFYEETYGILVFCTTKLFKKMKGVILLLLAIALLREMDSAKNFQIKILWKKKLLLCHPTQVDSIRGRGVLQLQH